MTLDLKTHSEHVPQTLMTMLIRRIERLVRGTDWWEGIPESVSVTVWWSGSTASPPFSFRAMAMGAGWVGPRAAPVHFCLANVHSSGSGGRNRFICRSEESVNENTALKVGGKKYTLHLKVKQNVKFHPGQFNKFTVAQFWSCHPSVEICSQKRSWSTISKGVPKIY